MVKQVLEVQPVLEEQQVQMEVRVKPGSEVTLDLQGNQVSR